jgi:hypothetical protein
MNEFDDPELRRMLHNSGGAPLDVDAAFDRVQGRVRQVKRRRAAAVGGAAGCLVLGMAVFAGTRANDGGTVRPAATSTDIETSVPASTSTPVTTASTSPTATTVTTTVTTTAPSVATTVTAPTTTPASSPTTAAGTTPPPATPVTRTFSGVGGSITVRLENGSLTLVSTNASAGFGTEIQKSSGDRVEVRFESDDHRTEIRVDVVGNSMSPEIDES